MLRCDQRFRDRASARKGKDNGIHSGGSQLVWFGPGREGV